MPGILKRRRLATTAWLAAGHSLLLAGVMGLLGWAPPARAAEAEFPEYKLKSAFIYNFAKFVAWPSNAFPNAQSPMVIGILGDDPFGPLLRQTLDGKTVNGRPFELRQLGRNDDPAGCHLLFLCRSEKERFPQILAALGARSILTVSEVDRFAHTGGMINLLVVNESIKFEINLQAAEKAGLKVSSKLSGVGTVIKSDPGKPDK